MKINKTVKTALVVAMSLTSTFASAYGNYYGSVSEISDTARIRSNEVGSCDSTVAKNTIQAGFYGDLGKDDNTGFGSNEHSYQNQDRDNKGAYLQLVVPFGGPKPIDCSKLARLMEKDYQMDLQLKELELQIKRAKLEIMAENLNDYSEVQANNGSSFSE